MGNTAEEKHLHALISIQKMREHALRFRRLHPQQRGTGVGIMTIKESTQTTQVLQVTSVEVTQKG